MKLEAKTRLTATVQTKLTAARSDTISGEVDLVNSKGNHAEFPSVDALFAWAEESNQIHMIHRVGRYAILFMAKDVAVASVYKDRLFDTPRAIQPTNTHFKTYASNRRREIKQVMTALIRYAHPMLSAVKKDADAELDFLNDHDKPLFSSRTQDWFHRLDHEARAEYVKKYPNTKFRAKPNLSMP